MLTVADWIFHSLENQGVEDVFMLPGGGCMYLVDSLARSKNISTTTLLHEQSVGIAAEAYSQTVNGLGVCLVTTGPGATNAITPCAAAWTDSTPVIFISGQVKTSDCAEKHGVRQLGFQELPISKIAAPITKMALRVTHANQVKDSLISLITTAISNRPGPVWLDIPLDVQSAYIDETPLAKIERIPPAETLHPEILENLVSAWNSAEKPIFLLGNGIRNTGATPELLEIARRTDTPVLLTWKAIDMLDELDVLNAGRPGAIAQRWSNYAQQDCDLFISVGARLDLGQIAYRPDNFAPHSKRFIVDVDKNELSKFPNSDTTFFINLDSRVFSSTILQEISSGKIHENSHPLWIEKIQKWKNVSPTLQAKHLSPIGGVSLYELIEVLSEELSENDILVPGSSGACSEVVMQAFKVKIGQRIFNSEGLGPMGFGIAAPIGASIAAPGKRVISLDGDGGFQMNIQELASLKHLNLPITIFVLNNNGYGSIKASQDSYFQGRRIGTDSSNGLGLPDIKNVVKGFGLNYLKISERKQIRSVIQGALNEQTPTIVEVVVDENHKTEPRTTNSIDKNGLISTNPMEELNF